MTVAAEQGAKPQISELPPSESSLSEPPHAQAQSEPPMISEEERHYPDGDGKPMAENDFCRDQAIYCTDALSHRYASDPRIYVAGNNFVYYRQGNNRHVISPDAYVVFGAEKRPRRSYIAWREGDLLPQVVFEITSPTTWQDDEAKSVLYERMGVPEYFQFDPSGDLLSPPLQGQRLAAGRYQPIPLEMAQLFQALDRLGASATPVMVECLRSQVLGLYLVVEGTRMRFYDVATGEPLLSSQERAEAGTQRAEAAAQRAEAEALARAEAELRA